ncbi:protein ABSCISIC ACID-INSENSITIVE 5 [Cajanus cajan]|uniref:Protein ABSCISIC ACID-INSENSITIVE 5 n=1 Tax=Cajanus cajan TaxID=3821 RepID=A0A151TVQ8_CAJCA|nr:protein ABSCISIC ACID-INSENSITIVE 5 [Cajanus cajan]XP_020211179.1 protein ABSCISIC ACID-INSENSITIVE 5 [Cajanus cajan]KYP71116.1 Protein ABSCISIC ACID-INSENSITIVE 5 [Cajanus cajan]
MVIEEGEMNSQLGEVESRLLQEANNPSSSLGRQSSIYSLTLDEFQHSLCENGKNFGSMNMDEFLSSIWSAEENISNVPPTTLREQPTLPRQPSLSLPPPLCRKTVDEVWSHIQKQQHNIQNTESAPRQPTFGEMTLEDFLVKAGVVREPCVVPPVTHSHQQQHYVNNAAMGPSFVSNVGYQVGNGKRDGGGGGGYCFGGGGYGPGPGPVSPANSSDGMGNENCGAQFGLDMGNLRGRKRVVDGPVEKVVERRQRRMIKNRESAARSRARKQAYTVELEAELNQLKEENAQLKQALAELERRRKQQCFEEVNVRVQTKAQKAEKKLRALRRNMSSPL